MRSGSGLTPLGRDDDYPLRVWQDPCGCVRARCSCGCSPQQIVEAMRLTLDDLLCDKHRGVAA